MGKSILCLDFDGVCHSYTSGWKGETVIPDKAVPGLFEFMEEADKFFELYIFSSRCTTKEGREAVEEWFLQQWHEQRGDGIPWRFPYLKYGCTKPQAFLTLDDRALTFTGIWPDMDMLRSFQPWYRKGK